MSKQLLYYKKLAEQIQEKCITKKKVFLGGRYTKVQSDHGHEVAVYYSDDHESWSVAVSGMEYVQFVDKVNISVDLIGEEDYIDSILKDMESFILNFDYAFTPKRRSLNFN